jgi:hypothetical protein
MTIDERIEALTMNLELMHRELQGLATRTEERIAKLTEAIIDLAHFAKDDERPSAAWNHSPRPQPKRTQQP